VRPRSDIDSEAVEEADQERQDAEPGKAQDRSQAQASGGDNPGSASTLREEAEATPAAPHGAREIPPELPRGEGGLLTDEGAFHAPPLRADSAPDAEAEGEGSAAGDEDEEQRQDGASNSLPQPAYGTRGSEPGPKGCWAVKPGLGGRHYPVGAGNPDPSDH
jgi:hypothetical protein